MLVAAEVEAEERGDTEAEPLVKGEGDGDWEGNGEAGGGTGDGEGANPATFGVHWPVMALAREVSAL